VNFAVLQGACCVFPLVERGYSRGHTVADRRQERHLMSGLVAVLAVGPDRAVDDDELHRLVACYETVRGPSTVTVVRGGSSARAARLEAAGIAGSDRAVSAEWPVTVGVPHAPTGGTPGSPAWLAAADGQFALVTYDDATGEAVVAGDPMGMAAVYVAEGPGVLYVSTSGLALARFLAAPADRLALQSFLVSGYHFGGGTHWQGVQRLEPGQAVRVGPRGRSQEYYWRPQIDRDVQRLPLRQAADHCIDASVSALTSRLAGQPESWIDLTGGYDSRLLALLLRRAGVRFAANTRHTTDPAEIEIARRIVELTGWTWVHPELPADWDAVLPAELASSLAWGDGNLEVLQLSRVLWVHRELARSRPALLSGGGGEHLQFAGWKSEFRAAGRSSRVNLDNFIDMRMIKPVNRSVLAGNPLPEVREDMRRRLAAWIEPYSGELNTTQLDLLYAYKSTGHFGAYRSADDGLLAAQLPFYFRPVFEAAFSTDYRHRNGHRLMRHMTERLDPSVAALPTTRGGPAQPLRMTNAHRFAPYFTQLARKAVTKVSDKALGRPLLLQQRAFPWASAANRSVLGDLSARGIFCPDRLRSADLYRPEALRALVEASQQPGFTQHALLGRIITVELCLQLTDTHVA
jgi:asparagine synthase (glutamine-hydrolysing)